MITLAWYFLKVIICSGILCGYYFLALRNKAFHRWNRFYILASVVISLLVPIMKINFFPKPEEKGTVVQMLQTISYGDEVVVEYSRNNSFELTTQNITEGFYLLVSLVFFFIFLISLYKITRLKKKFPAKKFEGISFINTSAKGTPFSFFKSIFWNKAIDLHSKSGQQIFNHEIAHIKEKHSYDKIFMNIVLIFFWINPFFWLLQKELFMIHEFIADKEALEDSDINSFAEMILQTVYPGQNFSLAHNFFYSPLKRRLLMLTKNKNPKVNYISRLLVLPLAAIVFFAFTLKVKNKNAHLYNGKTITVIIDAGHGGKDNGAHSSNGVEEKDITLSIAKKIAELNSNPDLKIILSRDNDQTISVKDRVVFAKNNKADLFIALHVNAAVNEQLNGFSVLVTKNYNEQNQLLGSALINELKKSYKTEDKIGERGLGVWVLDHNVCPAALVECGYLSNSRDAAFISNNADQEKIAQNILDAINVYASSEEKGDDKKSVVNLDSTRPRIINATLTKRDGSKISSGGEIIENSEHTSWNSKNAIVIFNGKEIQKEKLNRKNINAKRIILYFPNDKKGIQLYGGKAKNGVKVYEDATIENSPWISKLKLEKVSENTERQDTIPGKVYTKVQVEASFPGGLTAWSKYIVRAIQDSIDKFTKADFGTCVLQFIVDVDGGISDVKARTMKGTELAKVSIEAIENGPKWIPASQNGKAVAAYRLQPVTLQNPDDNKKDDKGNVTIVHTFKYRKTIHGTTSNNQKDSGPDKVLTKVENEASFPGGLPAWSKYITRAIQDSIDKFTEADYGTCVIRFIVDVDGSVSDVTARTMKGTDLASVAINAIKSGPKWIPASQNGRTVAAYRLQPVTLLNPDNKGKIIKFLPPKIVRDSGNVYVNPDGLARFPGGQAAWLKYISPLINKYGNKLITNKNNIGTCKVKFVVNTNGKVSEVYATTMEGTELAKVAVNAIKDGPNWIPGKQNGHAVNSFLIQPVRFALSDNVGLKNEPE
ncbi:MAG: N-acetylmuramoyl-L-alanine amidase [Ginsengibacter sp.]